MSASWRTAGQFCPPQTLQLWKPRENDRIDACVVRRGFTQQALLQTPFNPIREGAARLRHWNMRH